MSCACVFIALKAYVVSVCSVIVFSLRTHLTVFSAVV